MNHNPMAGEFKRQFCNGKIVGQVSPADYHRRDPAIPRGHPEYPMSFSELSEFSNCPSRWVRGYRDAGTEATEWGSLVDALVTTPTSFDDRYAVTPETYPAKVGKALVDKPWRFGAGYTDTWRDAKEAAGLIVVKHDTHLRAFSACKVMLADPEIGDLLSACGKRQVMVVAEYHDKDTGLVVPVRGLVDLWPDPEHPRFGKCLADVKTVANASPELFIDHVFRFRYNVQAAIYLDLAQAAGEDRTDFLIAAQESFEPYQVGRRHLSAEVLELGRMKYAGWLARYAYCLKTGQWQDYEVGTRQLLDGWGLLEFTKPWQISDRQYSDPAWV
jgi:hypothetical protein